MTENSNPGISSLLRFFTFVQVAVLVVTGLGLFFAPKLIESLWPWKLLPFNARFLGAVYSSSLIAAAMQLYYGRWSPARLVTPMILLFTSVIVALSFFHLREFDFQRAEVWLWFVFYLIVPINAAWHLWLYRNLPPADSAAPSAMGRRILLAQFTLLGIFGLALLVFPAFAKNLWSWKIDNFHAQLYSAAFLTVAIGAFILSKAASKAEWLTMGLTQAVLGIFSIIGVVVVDMRIKSVNWSSAGTWIWMILFAAMFVISLWMIKESRPASEKVRP
jgi:hypothetical protein